MSKELADRLEMIRHRLTLAKDRWGVGMVDETIAALRSEPVEYVLVGHTYKLPNNGMSSSRLNMTGHNLPDDTAIYAEPSRESRAEPVAGQLSAEQVEAKFDANDAPSPKYVEHIRFEGRDCVVLSPEGYEYLYSTALSSLRGTFADGIEAAAQFAEQWNAHSSLPRHIRALAQDQRGTAESSPDISARTDEVQSALHQQRSEAVQETKGNGSPEIAPVQSSDHPTDADELLRSMRVRIASLTDEMLSPEYKLHLRNEILVELDAYLARKEQ